MKLESIPYSSTKRLVGIVNLLASVRPETWYVRKTNLSGRALQHCSARHAFPCLEGLGA
jgi:hypothetical protein